jgi:Mrp family chromosome partitioning ATPase
MVERIKRALELARQERLSAARAAAALEAERPVAVAGAVAAGGTAFADALVPDVPAEAVSPATRRITVNESGLQDSRLLLPGVVGEAAHGFRLLRTQVMQRMRQRGWNTLAVLSAGPDEGKTFTAINLAIAIAALRDASALLVDLDLRLPRVHRRFGFLPTAGVEDCLRGAATLPEALVTIEGYPGLTLLPALRPVEHSSELIGSPEAQAFFRGIKEHDPNRIVIYDLPPVLATDDALTLVPQMDAALLVIGDGRTHREDLTRCLELLHDTPVLGTVLNGSRNERSAEYAY